MKKLLAILFCLTVIATFNSCQGPVGPPGANGVANIIAYNFYTSSSSWTYDNANELYYVEVQIPDITSDVVAGGTVQAFFSNADYNYFIALPTTQSLLWIGYAYYLGIGEIDWGLTDGSVPANPGTQYFKMVVIPPAARQANPDVNWNDYADIVKHFKITEIRID